MVIYLRVAVPSKALSKNAPDGIFQRAARSHQRAARYTRQRMLAPARCCSHQRAARTTRVRAALS
eukprot:6297903-Prymnesium_polylepis.2